MNSGRRRIRFRKSDPTNLLAIEAGEGVDDYSFRLGVAYAGHILRHITKGDIGGLDVRSRLTEMNDCCREHVEWMGDGVTTAFESLAGWGMTCSECKTEPGNGAGPS